MKRSIIDCEIEKEYYKQSNGKAIELSKIVPFFNYCQIEIEKGAQIVETVRKAVVIFCVNA
ncbi:MAG: hypothetical protein IPN19_12685 [Elusimicrobia bacterium]|nr:hypothetical protein [Elusimicrobiota bacterium]